MILLHGLAESATDLQGCPAARHAAAVGVLELMEMQIADVRELLGVSLGVEGELRGE